MRLLSHPFRLLPNGSAATVESDSPEGDVEGVAHLALTIRGERPLEPGYGIGDPTFAGLEPADLATGLAIYGPDVDVRSIETEIEDAAVQVVSVVLG